MVCNRHDIENYDKVEVMDMEGKKKTYSDVTDDKIRAAYERGYENGFNAGFFNQKVNSLYLRGYEAGRTFEREHGEDDLK